ncbi:MAG: glycosyltransferase family 4 protein [Chitinophagaceae bacterium]|nr:glycosyltransferase family 4 protein [Chitinophagaceae bacterium]
MKFLFIHTRYLQSAGGEDTTLDAEMKLMKEKGHEVRLLLFDNASMGNGIKGKINAGLSAIYNSSSAKKLREILNEYRPDIIHVHNFFFTASPSVLIEAKKHKIPVVVTIHNFRLVCANSLLLRDNKVCELCINHTFPWYGVKYKCYHDSAIQSAMVGSMSAYHKLKGTWRHKVDTYITPSGFIRSKLLCSSFNVPSNKIKVKKNFTEDAGLTAADERKPYFLFVGRIAKEKGIDTLLDAWSLMKNEELVIIGDGPEIDRIKTQYSDLKNVSFKGKQTKEVVLDYMKNCLALIFPSIWYEGLPLTIVEAFSTGTPVIGSSLGAMKEMIQDRKNGLLFEKGNAKSLQNAILYLKLQIENKDYSMYTNARISYMELYHPDKCYEEAMNIYNDLINDKKNLNNAP